jgi:hypothetical protein
MPSRYYTWRKGVKVGVVAHAKPPGKRSWSTRLTTINAATATRRLQVELRELGH